MEIINYLKRVNGSGHIVEHVGWHASGDYLLRQLFSTTDQPYRQHKYEVENEYEVIDKAEVDALERQTCKSRMHDFGPWERAENIDFWRKLPNGDRTCSFCGSLHPMDVISIIKEHGFGAIQASTKAYKWYIRRQSVSGATAGGIKYYRRHDTDEFISTYNSLVDFAKMGNSTQ